MEPELSKNGEKVEGESSEGSIFKGPTESSLKDLTVGKLLDTQSRQNPDKVAVHKGFLHMEYVQKIEL
ncbi:hypothetical protein CJF30_00003811 [Rutstroemia sp. NJR-2017a BBW]|nr:hypothetical protein CJF30_00003811 [Rutstroemia sp. NJR-2017a BBW]